MNSPDSTDHPTIHELKTSSSIVPDKGCEYSDEGAFQKISRGIEELLARQEEWRKEQKEKGEEGKNPKKCELPTESFALSMEDILLMKKRYRFIQTRKIIRGYIGKGTPLILKGGRTVLVWLDMNEIIFYYEMSKQEQLEEEIGEFLKTYIYPARHNISEVSKSHLSAQDILMLMAKKILLRKDIPIDGQIQATHVIYPKNQEDPLYLIISENKKTVWVLNFVEEEKPEGKSIEVTKRETRGTILQALATLPIVSYLVKMITRTNKSTMESKA